MNPVNTSHISIPQVRDMFTKSLDLEVPYSDSRSDSYLENSLHNISGTFKVIHHLLIARYSKPTMHHTEKMMELCGLDIETNYQTGEPRLLGFSYMDGFYHHVENPTLTDLFDVIDGLISNSRGTNIVTWGNLDINCLIRLFNPTEDERVKISGGLGGNFKDGDWIAAPPVSREIKGNLFFIDHYITGRSLRLGIQYGHRVFSIWVYNLSQFYETTIAQTASALKMNWVDYDKSTHLIDWDLYQSNAHFKSKVLASNEQDARIVREMATHLLTVFHSVFKPITCNNKSCKYYPA